MSEENYKRDGSDENLEEDRLDAWLKPGYVRGLEKQIFLELRTASYCRELMYKQLHKTSNKFIYSLNNSEV